MQLNIENNERQASGVSALLSAATCTLLMAVPVASAETGGDNAWRVDAGAMHYAEDERITVNEGTLRIRRQLDEESSVSVRTGYDSVSGSSPTGAVKIQSISGASGAAYLAKFNTTRVSVGADWDTALTELLRLTVNADHSTQSAYTSSGVGATLARDFNQRNTTLVAGIGYSYDQIKPETGIHFGLESTSLTAVRKSEETKDQLDIQLGLTQVITRTTLAQLNYVHSHAVGYMTNPYKIISVVNAIDGTTVLYDPLYEKRPRERDTNALYAQVNQSLGKDVAYFSYRYFWDDWGINSHTMDLKYRHPLGESTFIQPHVRYYQQTAADFYRSMLSNTEVASLPEFASADYRLAELNTTTFGLKIGYRPTSGGELSLRYEVIRQRGEERPGDAIGVQRDEGVFPDLNAMLVNVSYTAPF